MLEHRLISTLALCGVMLSACQMVPPANQLPVSSQSDMTPPLTVTTREPSVTNASPSIASACNAASGVSPPMLQATIGVQAAALALSGVDAVAGFNLTSSGSAVPRIAHLSVMACPGSNQVRLERAQVRFAWTSNGIQQSVDAGTLPISPVIVPPAPVFGGYGRPADVYVPLPAGVLRPILLKSAVGEIPKTIQAQITFVDERGKTVVNGNGTAFDVSIDVPTGAVNSAAVTFERICAGLPGPELPVLADDGWLHIVDLVSFVPQGGLVIPSVGLTSTSVSITLHTPPSGFEIKIASGSVDFTWTDASSRLESSVPKAFICSESVPAATSLAFGAPSTFQVPIDLTALSQATDGFSDLLYQGYAIAHIRFSDANGYPVQDERLEPIDVQIPILAR